MHRITEFGTQSISNTALSFAKLFFRPEPFLHALSAAALHRISEMESQNLANTSWAYATLGLADAPLMESIAAEARRRVGGFQGSFFEVFQSITDLLALSWSLAFSSRMTPLVAFSLKSHVLALGRELDRLMASREAPGQPEACGAEKREEEGDEEALAKIRLPGEPFALVNIPGIMVIFKPENWEVNRGDPEVHRREVEWSLLSDWVGRVMPRSRYPLLHSTKFDFGFIHRLDVPSSGLVLAAKTFAGHALLRFQLDTYELCREYIVVCCNPIDPRLLDLDFRLSIDKANMKSKVDERGTPARTFLKSQAHLWPQLDPDNLDTLVAIKIYTGRHHQIRAHLTHLQHPTASDGKYGLGEVMLRDDYLYGDMLWFESYFGRPVVPLFLEAGPKREAAKTEQRRGAIRRYSEEEAPPPSSSGR